MVCYFDEKGSFDAKNGWQDPYRYIPGPVLDGVERLWKQYAINVYNRWQW